MTDDFWDATYRAYLGAGVPEERAWALATAYVEEHCPVCGRFIAQPANACVGRYGCGWAR